MPKQLLDQILSETYTQTEALDRLRSLKNLVLVQLFGHGAKETKVDLNQPGSSQTTWLISLGADFLKNFNRDNVYQTFDELEKEIKSIKPLTIFLPFEMSEEALIKIGKYLRSSFGSNFLFEVKIDPELIAGTALVWNGIYKDYSVRQKIVENRGKILAMLQEYLKH